MGWEVEEGNERGVGVGLCVGEEKGGSLWPPYSSSRSCDTIDV
jgi:hypothetical protein